MKDTKRHIVIVGAGFAGIGMAIRLKQSGIHDFTILERSAGIGGTWRDNTYPGAACDVQSNLYSFSFEPNPSWSRTFAPQAEILAYLEGCVEKYGLTPHIRFETGVTTATWSEDAAEWTITTSHGDAVRARVVISGCGALTRPVLPAIEGLETFAGKTFHSARWDDTTPLEGKRAAVIGTGASAIQIVPQVAQRAAHLTVFQRTAPWIMPKADRPFTDGERARFTRWPVTQTLSRAAIYAQNEALALGFFGNRTMVKLAEMQGMRYLQRCIPDPALRAKLTPTFRLGCKRVLLTNDYYPALLEANVDLVTDPIARIEADGVVTTDGARETKHAIDTLILATGFQAAEQLAPFEMRGRDGRDLNAAWKDGAEAYLGSTIAGFPNLFMIFGPNVALGHSSMIYMIESQIAYILDAVTTMRRRAWRVVDVKPETLRAYNTRLHSRFPRTVWSSGCASWYRTKSGKNTTLWPSFTFEFRWRTRKFDAEKYAIVSGDDAASSHAHPRADADANARSGDHGQKPMTQSLGPIETSDVTT